MKKIFIFMLFAAVPCCLAAAINARWQNTELEFGEPLILEISGDVSEAPAIDWQRPAAIIPAGTRQSTYMINGRVSSSCSFMFSVNQAGIFNLPPVKIISGTSELATVPPTTVTVRSPEIMLQTGGRVAAEETISMFHGNIILPEGEIFTGMTVPVTMTLAIDKTLAVYLTELPVFSAGTAKTGKTDFLGENDTRQDGKKYLQYTFRTWFRPLVAGKAEIQAYVPVNAVLASRRESIINIPFTTQDINVLPLPPVPDGVLFTGITGDFKISCSITGKEFKAGEALTLQVRITPGNILPVIPEAVENIKVPDLKWQNCRIYPPEVTYFSDGSALIEYVIIPLTGGHFELQQKFAVFDSITGEYKIAESENTPEILPGTVNLPAATVNTQLSDSSAADDNIFPYQLRPWFPQQRANNIFLFAAFAAAVSGPAALLLLFIFRKGNKKSNKKQIIKTAAAQIHSAAIACEELPEENFRKTMDSVILPELRKAEELPAGSSIDDIVEKLKTKDRTLGELLQQYADSAYLPNYKNPALKSALCRKLKNYIASFIFIIVCCIPLSASGNADWLEQEKFFTGELESYPYDPVLWYDLGICAANKNEWGTAVWRLAGAAELAPGDKEIIAALQEAENKAGVAISGSRHEAANCFRSTSPEVWLFAGSIFWSLIWLLAAPGIRRKFSRTYRFSAAGIFSMLLLFSLTAWYTAKYAAPYPPEGIIITDCELHPQPGTFNDISIAPCRAGERFTLLDKKDSFWRITTGNGSAGWIKAENAALLPPAEIKQGMP